MPPHTDTIRILARYFPILRTPPQRQQRRSQATLSEGKMINTTSLKLLSRLVGQIQMIMTEMEKSQWQQLQNTRSINEGARMCNGNEYILRNEKYTTLPVSIFMA